MPRLYGAPSYPSRRIFNSNGRSWMPTGDHIQDAIDDLPSGMDSDHCGRVWLPRADSNDPMMIESSIIIHGSLHIVGLGLRATTLKLAPNVNDSMFKWVENNSYEYCFGLYDIKCLGDKGNQSKGSGLEINPTGDSDFRDFDVRRVAFEYFKEHGVYTTRGMGAHFVSLICEMNDLRGFYQNGGTTTMIRHCKFSANGTFGAGITSANARIIGCELQDNGEHGLGIGSNGVIVMGNSLRYNGKKAANNYDAIHIFGVDDCTVVANTIRGTSDATAWTRYGVALDAGSDRTRVGLNTYIGLGTGEVLDNGSKTRIEGLGQGAYGIGGTPTATDWSVGGIVRNTDDNTFWIKDYTGTMRKLA